MTRDSSIWLGLGLLAGAAGLTACGGETAAVVDQVNASACVDIPDGYYLFTDGKFSPTSADLAIEEPSEVTQRAVAWSEDVNARLQSEGYDWLTANVAGSVGTLLGTAPDLAAKEAGFAAGQAAILSDIHGAQEIRLVVDGISVEGGEPAVGVAVAALSDIPTPEACQATFRNIMDGRNIDFASGNSSISEGSARLLDAISGAALLCSNYTIEIGGHTDARGADSYNLRLSQDRADAVKGYMEGKGVEGSKLRAVGYGESRPIDPEQTVEAYAKNRRMEFTVISN